MDFVWNKTARVVEIKLDWTRIEGTVVKAGTPISAAGCVANTESAIGLLLNDAIFVNRPDANGYSAVLIGGVVDLTAVENAAGITLEAVAKEAMKDITFLVDGAPEPPEAVVLDNQPDSTATTIAALKTDFNTLLAELKEKGFMAPDPEPEPEPEPGDGDE